MNILLLTQFLSVTKGGGEHVFSNIANGLAKRGHNIHIITHKIENENYEQFHKNVKISFVSSIRYEGGLPPSFKDNIRFVCDATKRGFSMLRKEKIDLIHSNNFSPALVGSIISSLTHTSHITTVHDIFSLCGKNYWQIWGKQSNVSKINVLLAPIFEKMIVRLKYNAVHTVSDTTRDDLIKFGVSKPIYIINPSISPCISSNNSPSELQFVFVGRLVFYKNLETVIKAIAIVKQLYPDVKLKIIGDGPNRNNLVNLVNHLAIQDNVEFYGYAPEQTKFEMISSSIAMVFPSLCEGFGIVILESFSCSRPVLVSNVRPLPEIIEHEKDGFILEARDEQMWADAMSSLISNPNLALKMGLEGKKKLQIRYTEEEMIAKVESMYKEVVQKSKVG